MDFQMHNYLEFYYKAPFHGILEARECSKGSVQGHVKACQSGVLFPSSRWKRDCQKPLHLQKT